MGRKELSISGTVFVNYTNPSQQAEKGNKRKVASYIGTHFRNRSAPARSLGNRALPISSSSREDDRSASNSGNCPKNHQLQLPALITRISHDTHGFRADPFQSYPIEAHNEIDEAVDFFLNAYGPTHFLRSSAMTDLSDGSIVNKYFKYGMQHPVMFEALIASSLCHLRIHLWELSQPDKETMHHYGKALSKLQEIFREPNGHLDDSVLFAILGLLDIEYLLGNVVAFEAHLKGLSRVVGLRGGLASLDWPGVLRPAITGFLAFWRFNNGARSTDTSGFEENLQSSQVTEPLPLSIVDESIWDTWSEDGTRQLILENRLSPQVISHAVIIYNDRSNIDLLNNTPFGGKNAANLEARERGWILLTDMEKRSIPDRLLLIALQHTLLDTSHGERFSRYYSQQVKEWATLCTALLDEVDACDTSTSELLIFVSMKLAGTMKATFLRMEATSEEDVRFQMLLKMMSKYPFTRNWQLLEAVLVKFKWHAIGMPSWRLVWKWASSWPGRVSNLTSLNISESGTHIAIPLPR